MAEHFPHQHHNNESSHYENDSFNDRPQEAARISLEERARLTAAAEAKHKQRDAEKSERVADALETVHAQYDSDSMGSDESEVRRVVFNGEVAEVTETYIDGMGHTWVELADGRHTMQFEEYFEPKKEAGQESESAGDLPLPESEKDTKIEAALSNVHALYDTPALLTMETPPAEDNPHQMRVFDPKNNPDDAKRLAEVIAQRQAEEAAKLQKQQNNIDTMPSVIDTGDSEEDFRTPVDDLEARRKLRQYNDTLRSIDAREQNNLHRAIDQLTSVVSGLSRTESGGIGDTLDGHINTSIENAIAEVRAALMAEREKAEYKKRAEMVIGSLDVPLRGVSQADELRSMSGDKEQEVLRTALERLGRSDPKHYRRSKDEFISLVRQSIRSLDDVRIASGANGRKINSLLAA